jgi:benzodiazapine receptor
MNTSRNSDIVRQVVNVVAFIFTIVLNYLSNSLPLNGRTPAEISDALPSYFTPANFAFSIWGVIYTALTAFVIYQALPAQRENPQLRRLGYLFALTCLQNGGWILAWHYGYFALSVVIMLSLLVTLIAIYLRTAGADKPADKWFVHLPFRIYLGWISVATIANSASVANHLGWNGFGIAEPVWSAVMIAVAAILTITMLWRRADLVYAAVIVWSVFAIRAKFPDVAVIANTAALAIAAILVFMVLTGLRSLRRSTLQTQPA